MVSGDPSLRECACPSLKEAALLLPCTHACTYPSRSATPWEGWVQELGLLGWDGAGEECPHQGVPLTLPQDWKEQYIHENYSRALEGEGFVEQVSPTQGL